VHRLIQGFTRAPNSGIDDSRKGKIYLFDTSRAHSQPEELRIDAADDFRLVSPQGISAWNDAATGDYHQWLI